MSNQQERTGKVITKTGVTFPVLLDNRSISKKLYKVRLTPTTLLINKEGSIVFKHIGFYPGMEGVLEREIQSLIGGPA